MWDIGREWQYTRGDAAWGGRDLEGKTLIHNKCKDSSKQGS